MKRIVGAAAAVLMLTLASSAHSAVMIANIRGDYNDAPEWMTWRVTLMYDTDLLTHNTVGGDYYTWTAASGDPHALISAKGVYGYSSPPYTTTFNVTEFTSFTINRSGGLYSFEFKGQGISVSDAGVGFGPYPEIDQPGYFYGPWPQYGTASVNGLVMSPPHAHSVEVLFASVPEPATWAMMIIGFSAVGSMARRSRRTLDAVT